MRPYLARRCLAGPRYSDLLDAGLIQPGDNLVWERPRLGVTYRASVAPSGAIVLDDGRQFASPSRAAKEAAEVPACDGWYAWRLPRLSGTVLHDLRGELLAQGARAVQAENATEG